MPQIIAPGLYAATHPRAGRAVFTSATRAALWLIDPDSPIFGGAGSGKTAASITAPGDAAETAVPARALILTMRAGAHR